MQTNQIDKLILEGRKILNMTGVSSVDGFSEQCVKLTVSDSKAQILGEGLKITTYNKQDGNLIVEGKIDEIKYLVKKPPVLKRIFK
ncbi:MAG: YabP/YqfC family sporulation protein [Clostridia bacterium]|nr:YabP/YqfC family sporulation protein [Clostridia bacterium]